MKNRLLSRLGLGQTYPQLLPQGTLGKTPPRVLLYCASNIGLGHLHRLKCVAHELRIRLGTVDFLLITDNQTLSAEEIGSGMALVRLPEFEFQDDSFANRPAGLSLTKNQLRDLRANLILTAAAAFQPHVLLMDTNPHGKKNELEPLLRQLRRLEQPPLRILEFRDIPFPPEETSRLQASAGKISSDLEMYDLLFVAGDPAFFDLATSYNWDSAVTDKLHYLGFVLPEHSQEVGAKSDRRQIVAAMGGGWELDTFGRSVVEAFLRAFPNGRPDVDLTLVTGPGVSESDRRALADAARGREDVRIVRYNSDFDGMLRACDLAILQAGSTPFQILESDIPMLLYSRQYSTQEQQCRAERLARYPGIRRIGTDDLESERLSELIQREMEQPREARKTELRFDGAARAAELIATHLEATAGRL